MRWRTKHGSVYTMKVRNAEDFARFLQAMIDAMPKVPPLQMEFDFGEGLNWWWYDCAGALHPNDTDYPSETDEDYEPHFDEDMPF